MKLFLHIVILGAFMFHHCSADQGSADQAASGGTTFAVLKLKDAETRVQQIRKVDYKLYFKLPESADDYRGKVEATLDIAPNAAQISKEIFLDFAGGGLVQRITLNGKSILFKHDGLKIFIEANLFQAGSNQLVLDFTHPYGKSGFGFHRTRDNEDGEHYMFSDFEPYNANKAFPLFDQPDLKATYTLSLDAPAKWEVISNTRESKVTDGEPGWKHWQFPTSARFSTYLFALIAGPFQKWESKTTSGVPLRLFARKSLAQYVARDAAHWFQVTDEGFKFFEEAFGYPYPFGKYDQILTPDYNQGAMENVGAVTFTENYAFRTQPTPLRVLRRAETITHELAHMWFGDLVTMKWWDDLWLNESFATYVSNLAMSKFQDRLGLANVWQQFNAHNKEWAYLEDDFVTTHPIVGTVSDTQEATANFDGITYGKGASVLKQLVYYIGEDAFLQGLKNYFKEFEYKNVVRTDFLNALSAASGKDLVSWENAWFKSSGTNTVQVVLSSRDGKIEKLVLKQSPDGADKKLRPHRTEVGLYDLNSHGEIVLREVISVTYETAETEVREAVGKPIPSFIFPNVGDHDFVSIVLDEKSLATLEKSLSKISDPFLRQMLWSTIWGMVTHANLPAQQFADIALNHLKHESDLAVLAQGLGYLQASFWYMAPEVKAAYQNKTETFIYSLFKEAPAGNPSQIILFAQYLSVARSAEAEALMKQWLGEDEIAPGFQMDQERRWSVIARLAHLGTAEAKEMIQQELKKDPNDKGVIASVNAEVLIPQEANKKLWLSRLLAEDKDYPKLSIERSRVAMRAYHNSDRPELTAFLNQSYFDILLEMTRKFPNELNASFAGTMYPIECSDALDQKTEQFLAQHPELSTSIQRELKKNRQTHQRTVKARALSVQAALR